MAFELGDHDSTNELLAAQAGYGPFFEAAAEDLGSLSDAAQRIEAARAEVGKSQANALLLRSVADLFPRASGPWQSIPETKTYDIGVFEIEGADSQYRARIIQASTLWLLRGSGSYLLKSTNLPCYLVGRCMNTDDSQKESLELLLLPASGIKGRKRDNYYPLIIVTVRKDDLLARDQLINQLVGREFQDVDGLIDPQNGRLIVNSGTEGSIKLGYQGRGKSSVERVLDKGIRLSDKPTYLDNGVGDDILESFEVDKSIAILAAAFDQTENIRSLLANGVPVALTREQQLVEQNEALRSKIGAMLIAGGMDKYQAQLLIERQFPSI
jgi:hypothetical protein